MENKMILGTVQLGVNYGINNELGKPSEEEAYEILDYAFKNGVKYLDTASAYGNSEEIIGKYISKTGNEFEICTKLPIDIESVSINQYYKKSILNLCVKKINVLYLHRFEQCKNKEVLESLNRLKQEGKILNIGISIYEPDELDYIINNLKGIVDVVQLPFNLFDTCRWTRNNLLERAQKSNIKIFTRSVYLQGLFFVDPKDEKAIKLNVSSQLIKLRKLVQKNNCSISELAVSYINSIDCINNYLIGCETLEQLKANIKINNNPINIDDNMKKEILAIANTIDDITIDPRRWNE